MYPLAISSEWRREGKLLSIKIFCHLLVHGKKMVVSFCLNLCRIPNLMVRSQLTLRNLRSAMQRARAGVFPRIPDTLLSLSLILEDPMWESLTRTIDSLDSIYLGTAIGNDVSINLVFMSSRGLQVLREADRIFADGTFSITPSVEACYQVIINLKYSMS